MTNSDETEKEDDYSAVSLHNHEENEVDGGDIQ